MRGKSGSRHNEERCCCRRRDRGHRRYAVVISMCSICKGGDDRGLMAKSPKKVSCNQMTLFLLTYSVSEPATQRHI